MPTDVLHTTGENPAMPLQMPIPAALALGLFALSSTASAEIIDKDYFINPAGNCNGALPSFEGALRKRPQAIRNEGGSNAFVTCSIPRSAFDDGFTRVGAYFTNGSETEQTINCTLVDGWALAETGFYPRSLVLTAGDTDFLVWEGVEFELENGKFSSWINFSCNLPVSTEINIVGGLFGFENGVGPAVP